MDLLDFFTSETINTTQDSISSTRLEKRRRSPRDTLSNIPIFENTLNRLYKAHKRADLILNAISAF